MRDSELAQAGAEAAVRVGAAVVGPELELARLDAALDGCGVDDGDRLGGPAADIQGPADDLTGAAVDRGIEVSPAVIGDPDAGHVEMPELVGSCDLEVAGP